MVVITQKMIEEAEAKRKEIDMKLKAGEVLTIEEIWMMGDQKILDDLPALPMCFDMYYYRLYLPYKEGVYAFGKELSPAHLFNFESLVTNWGMHLDAEYPAGTLLAASQKETSQEDIKKFEREWEKKQGVIDEEERDRDFFELLAGQNSGMYWPGGFLTWTLKLIFIQ